MEYLTGQKIDTTAITWTCGGGQLAITLVRNADRVANGWIPAGEHSVDVQVAGKIFALWDEIEHPQHGYCIQLDMGKITVRVPAEHEAAVRAMLNERAEYNAAALKSQLEGEAAYEAHRAGVLAMLNK